MNYLALEVPKPADRFANDFLGFLKSKAPGEWEPDDCKVKVMYCTAIFWAELMPFFNQSVIGNPGEYADPLDTSNLTDWRRINAINMQPTVTVNGRPSYTLSREERRQAFLQTGFTEGRADEFSTFDAVVFLNVPNIEARARARVPFPDHELIAHEVTHIAERLSANRIHICQWDNRFYESPEVEKLFAEFLESVGTKEFSRRYFARPT